jgi:nucleoside-diphosphate-sugar epimerase
VTPLREVLVTGADGYIGRAVCAGLVAAHPHSILHCWMRAADAQEFERKKHKLAADLTEAAAARIRYHHGDLRAAEPFSGVPVDGIDAIVHTAAVIRFNVEADLADSVNIEGTRRLVSLATRCPRLRQLLYLSSIYATGERAGILREDDAAAPPAFANHYERSKHAAEQLLRDTSPVPPTLVRVPTLIADDAGGHVSQFNVFHNTVRLLYNGLISVLPGNPETPVYLSTRSEIVAAVLAILAAGEAGRTYHACPSEERAVRLQQLLDDAFTVFREDPRFVQKRILPPKLADAGTFDTLASAMSSVSRGVVADALGSIVPFARQLYVSKSVEQQRMAALAPQLFRADPREAVIATTRWLTRTQWGRLDG